MGAPSPFPATLDEAQRGSHDALADLYRRYAPAVLGYLRGQGARDAEDLASEVFVGMVRGLERFDGDEAAFRTWLFSIAHRRLVDERRRHSRRVIDLVEPEKLPEIAAPGADVAEEALVRMAAGPTMQLLNELTEEQRSVILLRIVADLPVADVAGILGKTEGAVKTLQQRAVRRLARMIPAEPVT